MEPEPSDTLVNWLNQGKSAVQAVLDDKQTRLNLAAQERDSLEQNLSELREKLLIQEKLVESLDADNQALLLKYARKKLKVTSASEQCQKLSVQLEEAIEERDEARKEMIAARNSSDIFLAALKRSLSTEASTRNDASKKYENLRTYCEATVSALDEQMKRAERAEQQLAQNPKRTSLSAKPSHYIVFEDAIDEQEKLKSFSPERSEEQLAQRRKSTSHPPKQPVSQRRKNVARELVYTPSLQGADGSHSQSSDSSSPKQSKLESREWQPDTVRSVRRARKQGSYFTHTASDVVTARESSTKRRKTEQINIS